MKLAMGDRSRKEFLQVINRPNRYISREALDAETVSFEELRWFYEDKEWMCDRIDRMEEDLKTLKAMTPYGAINYIRYGVGYEEFLKDYASYRKLRTEELYEVLDELAESAKGYKTFEEWFTHIAQYTEKLKEQARQQNTEKEGVVISTLHSAKGLEFDRVFIMDVNEGIIPYRKAAGESDVEEERRLLYVGMTRARKELSFSMWENAMRRSWSLPGSFWNLVWWKGVRNCETGSNLSLCRKSGRVDWRMERGEEPGKPLWPASSPLWPSGIGL